MRTLIITLAVLMPFASHAQSNGSSTPEFDGVKIDSTLSYCVSQYTKKGFTVSDESNKNTVSLTGKLGADEIELFITATPITHKVWKASVYFPKEDTWSDLKAKYSSLKDILVTKYGAADKDYDFFSSPYKEGEGDEMSAVTDDKCHYAAFWKQNLNNTTIFEKIAKYKQVSISYENGTNSALDDVEKNKATADGL